MKRDALLLESELTGNLVLKTRDPVKRMKCVNIPLKLQVRVSVAGTGGR